MFPERSLWHDNKFSISRKLIEFPENLIPRKSKIQVRGSENQLRKGNWKYASPDQVKICKFLIITIFNVSVY